MLVNKVTLSQVKWVEVFRHSEDLIYISNRVNSYSLDPNDYSHLNQIPTLKAIGVVQYQKSLKTAIEFEKIFVIVLLVILWAFLILKVFHVQICPHLYLLDLPYGISYP